MPVDSGAPEGQETGGQLREKLEATLNENKGLKSQLAANVVKNFPLVSAEDLEGLTHDQFEVKAQELQASRQSAEDAAVARRLGVPVEELDKVLAGIGQGETPKPAPAARSPFASTGALPGQVPGSLPQEGLYGESRIKTAVREK